MWESVSGIYFMVNDDLRLPENEMTYFVHSIKWDPKAKVYALTLCCQKEHVAVVKNAVRAQYDDLAADTWMEGDIRVNKEFELHLE